MVTIITTPPPPPGLTNNNAMKKNMNTIFCKNLDENDAPISKEEMKQNPNIQKGNVYNITRIRVNGNLVFWLQQAQPSEASFHYSEINDTSPQWTM